jgi:hypothetical protein
MSGELRSEDAGPSSPVGLLLTGHIPERIRMHEMKSAS